MDDKTSIIPSPTSVDPSCVQDDPKPVVKKKSRFPLFRVSRSKSRSGSNASPKQNKKLDKNNSNDNLDSAPNSPAHFYSTPPLGSLRKYASAGNLEDLAAMTMSPSVSTDNLQEAEGTMSPSGEPSNLSATTRHKHSVSTGNIHELMTNNSMTYSKSTSNLQDLKFGMRRYASALNLLDLDINEEVDAEEEGDDQLENCAGDVSIDDKADQFIAQFYQQMRSQHKPKRKQHYYV